MDLLHRARMIARHVGLDVTRYHLEADWNRNLVRQLESHNVDLVLDVGANSGQYARSLREAGFGSRIISFEPLSEPFIALEKYSSKDALWDCQQRALGDTDGTISVNVAGNQQASSSILPMLQNHREAYPQATYVGVEEVSINRLDTLAPHIFSTPGVAFLKIDVQGFEKQVLTGGESTLRNRCVGMQIELSLEPLYEGSMLIREAFDLAYSYGFTLTGLRPGFTDTRSGRMLQADGIFFRADSE